jgi:hypothetical protein
MRELFSHRSYTHIPVTNDRISERYHVASLTYSISSAVLGENIPHP